MGDDRYVLQKAALFQHRSGPPNDAAHDRVMTFGKRVELVVRMRF